MTLHHDGSTSTPTNNTTSTPEDTADASQGRTDLFEPVLCVEEEADMLRV
jgi:hypothetical protein